MAKIATAGGNVIHMEDKEGSERILMHAPKQQSFIRIGAPNDPVADDDRNTTHWEIAKRWGIAEKTPGPLDIQAAMKQEIIAGASIDAVIGGRALFTLGFRTYYVLGLQISFHKPARLRWKKFHCDVAADNWRAYAKRTALKASKKAFVGFENEAIGRETCALMDGQNGYTTKLDAISNGLEAKNNQVGTKLDAIDALGEQINARLLEMQTIGTKLKKVGKKLEMVGTGIETNVLACTDAGTSMKNAGVTLKNVGAIVKQAPVINQV
jgi:type VI secretion system secreted protein VgrG